jgi:hypothetical protein
MILTGKCREGFINFMCKNHKYIKWCDYQTMSEVVLNALIIEYFDSIGVYIEIQVLKVETYPKYSFNMRNISFNMLSQGDYFKSRQEATEKAIEKANDLINQDLTINLLTKNKQNERV